MKVMKEQAHITYVCSFSYIPPIRAPFVYANYFALSAGANAHSKGLKNESSTVSWPYTPIHYAIAMNCLTRGIFYANLITMNFHKRTEILRRDNQVSGGLVGINLDIPLV